MSKLLYATTELPQDTHDKLKKLEECLLRWNKNINIVADNGETIWDRHITDSLQLIPLFQNVNKLADMGSGIGFPAIPIAIANPDIDVFAIEVREKRSALMNELIREVRIPNLHVLSDRVEKVFLSHMDVVCSRAFGEFTRDAKLAYKMLKPGGSFMTFKAAEQNQIPPGYETVNNHSYTLPVSEKRFHVVVAEKAGEM